MEKSKYGGLILLCIKIGPFTKGKIYRTCKDGLIKKYQHTWRYSGDYMDERYFQVLHDCKVIRAMYDIELDK